MISSADSYHSVKLSGLIIGRARASRSAAILNNGAARTCPQCLRHSRCRRAPSPYLIIEPKKFSGLVLFHFPGPQFLQLTLVVRQQQLSLGTKSCKSARDVPGILMDGDACTDPRIARPPRISKSAKPGF